MMGMGVQEDRLWVADPKAINHILQKSGYLYAKPSDIQEQAALFNDRGIGSVEGELSTTISYFLLLARLTIHRRGTQAPQEGDGSRVWSRRG